MHRKKLTLSIALALSMKSHIAYSQFDAAFNLSEINGQNGFVINGINTSDFSGDSVSKAGDINGDGIDDLIIGAHGSDTTGSGAGSSYVVFGSDQGFGSTLELANLNGQNGFVINGVNAGDQSGKSVSKAGDVNGDGVDDLIIGAPSRGSKTGASYVVFGSDQGFSSAIGLASLNGQNGFVINGVTAGDESGGSVSSAGDVNGDGIDDLIIGAPYSDSSGESNAGSSYVVFGSDQGFGSTFELANIDGLNGFEINGINAGDNSGVSVSNAGDVNGDGLDDVFIGASFASPNAKTFAGASYVVFGSDQGFNSSIELIDLNGQNGLVINGVKAGDKSGASVSNAGDVNGDGIDDVIIGAYRANLVSAGASYVVFGLQAPVIPNPINLDNLNGLNGFAINGLNDNDLLGYSVSSAGDVNGDGIDDVIIGAENADRIGVSNAGASYVVFGSNQGFNSAIELANLNGQDGFVINGVNTSDFSGRSVSAAGDVNGDGIDDLIIGALGVDPGGESFAGASYVVFGDDIIFKDDFQININ